MGTPTATSNFNHSNNRLTTTTYDAAGNQLGIPAVCTNCLQYDAENRLVSYAPSGTTYTYDGNGQRVQKIANGVTITYVYDALGKLAEEFTSGSFPTRPCTTCYLSSDHLGSTRMVTDQNGALVSLHDYLPFGEEIISGDAGRPSVNGAQDNTDQKFTGQLRDSESNLDYFNARYFAAALGRFTSPDPANAGADPTNPQSWNAYAYVLGNPLATTDPTGLDPMTNPVPVSCPGCTTTVYGGTPDPIDLVFYQSLTGDLGSSQGLFSITHTEQQAPPPPLKMPKQPPKTGTTVAQKLTCAAKFGNDHSLGALFGGGKVAMFFGGNTISSLTNLGLAVTGNGPPLQYPGAIALNGPALGLPVNDVLRFAGKQSIPQLTSASGFVRSQALQTVFKVATGPSALTTLTGEAALQGGITAGEYASGAALAKFVYDGATFLYGYFGECQ